MLFSAVLFIEILEILRKFEAEMQIMQAVFIPRNVYFQEIDYYDFIMQLYVVFCISKS